MAFIDPVSAVGQQILVGLTYFSQDGEVNEQVQFYGMIHGVNIGGMMLIRDRRGKNWEVPFLPNAIAYGPRGEYHLTATGETVTNPELITTWRVYLPQKPGEVTNWQANYAPFHNFQVPREWEFQPAEDENYEQELLRRYGEGYLGQTLLVSLEYYRMENGQPRLAERVDHFGTITGLSFQDGIIYQLADGSKHRLPAKLSWLEPAEPGEYTVRSTGEVAKNPDYISIWQVTKE